MFATGDVELRRALSRRRLRPGLRRPREELLRPGPRRSSGRCRTTRPSPSSTAAAQAALRRRPTQVVGVIGSEPVGAACSPRLPSNGAHARSGARRSSPTACGRPTSAGSSTRPDPMASAGIQGRVAARPTPTTRRSPGSFVVGLSPRHAARLRGLRLRLRQPARAGGARPPARDDPEKIREPARRREPRRVAVPGFAGLRDAARGAAATSTSTAPRATSTSLDNGDVRSSADYEQFVFDDNGNDVPVRTLTVGTSSAPDGRSGSARPVRTGPAARRAA